MEIYEIQPRLFPLPLSALGTAATHTDLLLLPSFGASRSPDIRFRLSQVAKVDSTRDLVLALFPPQVHANRSLQTLASLLEVFTRAGTLHARLDALVAFYSWLRRKDDRLPARLAIA